MPYVRDPGRTYAEAMGHLTHRARSLIRSALPLPAADRPSYPAPESAPRYTYVKKKSYFTRVVFVYGVTNLADHRGLVSARVAQNWFKRFQSGNFGVKDEPCTGRPVMDKIDLILEKVEQFSDYDIAEEL
ncbi:hypothetical protein EVAR_37038_1 [Eumeta japonica]|uniref:Mos1 transposase HTH domain-containing protein n=1 Tax=Eumeta variegata TaxID=151549 RepID=A0A4C1WIJ5_EUMVA|nr:hypothetical protein EVAR_37038_1 [Eumeta japonica]